MQSDVFMTMLTDAYQRYNEAYDKVVKQVCAVTLHDFDRVYDELGPKRKAYLDAVIRDGIQPEERFNEIIDDIGKKHIDVLKRRAALL